MQTFLPYTDFLESARVLDYRRLGKQRTEAFQLLCTNGDEWALKERKWRIEQGLMKNRPLGKGWKNHPAALMWKPYSDALHYYMNVIITEWIDRGYKNTMRFAPEPIIGIKCPSWLGNPNFHSSHRAALLAKDFNYYKQFGWSEAPAINYIWP